MRLIYAEYLSTTRIRNWQFAIGNLQFAIGNLQLAIYNWQFEIGNWQFEISNLQLTICNLQLEIGNGEGSDPQSESDKEPLLLDHHGSQQSIEFY